MGGRDRDCNRTDRLPPIVADCDVAPGGSEALTWEMESPTWPTAFSPPPSSVPAGPWPDRPTRPPTPASSTGSSRTGTKPRSPSSSPGTGRSCGPPAGGGTASPADAEDAFQATFLVLARRADRVRQAAAVGGWLFRVAVRLSARTRRALARPSSRPDQRRPGPRAGRPGRLAGPGGHPRRRAGCPARNCSARPSCAATTRG